MTTTTDETYHPAVTNLPDDHPTIFYGASHDAPPTVEVGPTMGNSDDETTHVANVSFGWCAITWDDPDKLDEAGRILRSAAMALRARQTDPSDG